MIYMSYFVLIALKAMNIVVAVSLAIWDIPVVSMLPT
jgi:hypothetical protein